MKKIKKFLKEYISFVVFFLVDIILIAIIPVVGEKSLLFGLYLTLLAGSPFILASYELVQYGKYRGWM